jgi:uncharacterized protein (UPF0303 family)
MIEQTNPDLRMMLEEIRGQVAERTLARFDHEDARRIGSAAAALAERDHLPIVVAVSRGTQRVFHAAFAGTTAEHDDWVRRKINTALRHEIPSLEFVLRQELSGQTPDWLDQRKFAIAGGAVPIIVAGITVGAIAVSGLVGSIREDHDLAMDALRVAAKRR